MYFHGPKDKTDPSYHAACAYQRELAAKVGNTNGQMPEDSDPDSDSDSDEDDDEVERLPALGL